MSNNFYYTKFKKDIKIELRKLSVNKLICPLGITFDQIKLIYGKITNLSKNDKLIN